MDPLGDDWDYDAIRRGRSRVEPPPNSNPQPHFDSKSLPNPSVLDEKPLGDLSASPSLYDAVEDSVPGTSKGSSGSRMLMGGDSASLPATFSSMLREGVDEETGDDLNGFDDSYGEDGSGGAHTHTDSGGSDKSERVPDYISKMKAVVSSPHHMQAMLNFQRDVISEKDYKISKLKEKCKVLKNAMKQFVGTNAAGNGLPPTAVLQSGGESEKQDLAKELKASKVLLMTKENTIQQLKEDMKLMNHKMAEKEESQHLLVKKNIELQQDLYREKQFIKKWERTKARINQKPTVKSSLWGSALDVVAGVNSPGQQQHPEALDVIAKLREKNNKLKEKLKKNQQTVEEVTRRYDSVLERNRADHRAMMEIKATLTELEAKSDGSIKSYEIKLHQAQQRHRREIESLEQDNLRLEARHREDTQDLVNEHKMELREFQLRIKKREQEGLVQQRRLRASFQVRQEDFTREIQSARIEADRTKEMLETLKEGFKVQKDADDAKLKMKDGQIKSLSDTLEGVQGEFRDKNQALEEAKARMEEMDAKHREQQDSERTLKKRSIRILRALQFVRSKKKQAAFEEELKRKETAFSEEKDALESSSEAWKSTANEFEQKSKTAAENIQMLSKEVKELRTELSSAQSLLETTQQDLLKTDEGKHKAEEELSATKSALDAESKEKDELISELEGAQQALATNAQTIEALQNDIESERASLKQLEGDYSQIRADLEQALAEGEAVGATARETTQALETRLKELERARGSAVASAAANAAAAAGRFEEVSQELKRASEELERARREGDESRKQLSQATAQLAERGGRVAELEKQVDSLKSAMHSEAESKAKVESLLKQELDQARTNLRETQQQVESTLSSAKESYERRIESLERSLESVESKHRGEVQRLEEQLKALEKGDTGKLEQLSKERESALKRELEDTKASMEAEKKRLEQQLRDEASKAAEEVEKSRSVVRKLVGEITCEAETLAKTKHSQKQRMDEIMSQLREAEGQRERAGEKIKMLSGKVEDLEKEKNQIRTDEQDKARQHFEAQFRVEMSKMKARMDAQIRGTGGGGRGLGDVERAQLLDMFQQEKQRIEADAKQSQKELIRLQKRLEKQKEISRKWRDKARSLGAEANGSPAGGEGARKTREKPKDAASSAAGSNPGSAAQSNGDGKGPEAVSNRKKLPSTSSITVEEARQRLTELLAKHNPSRVGNVDKLLKKHKGRELQLIKAVQTKYEGGKQQSKEKDAGWLGGVTGGLTDVVGSGLGGLFKM